VGGEGRGQHTLCWCGAGQGPPLQIWMEFTDIAMSTKQNPFGVGLVGGVGSWGLGARAAKAVKKTDSLGLWRGHSGGGWSRTIKGLTSAPFFTRRLAATDLSSFTAKSSAVIPCAPAAICGWHTWQGVVCCGDSADEGKGAVACARGQVGGRVGCPGNGGCMMMGR
jgi:hypothetical protein